MKAYPLRFVLILLGIGLLLPNAACAQKKPPARPKLVGESMLGVGSGADKVAIANFKNSLTGKVAMSFEAYAEDGKVVNGVIMKRADKGTITVTSVGVKIGSTLYVGQLDELEKIMDLGQRFFNDKLKPPDPKNDTTQPLLDEMIPILTAGYPDFWYVKS